MKALKIFLTLTFIILALRPALGQLGGVPTPITTLPTNNNTVWYYAASSTNGVKWVVSGFNDLGSLLYISTNSGTTWSSRTNFFGYVACSANGGVVLCASQSRGVMLSTNFCDSWISTGFANGNPGGVTMSADGTKLAVSSPIKTSTNSGASWYTSSMSAGLKAWSADGTHLAAISTDKNVYISTNAGVTWTQTPSPQTAADWTSLAISGDGSVLAICSLYENDETTPGGVYFSTDYGATWSGNVANGEWLSGSVSADGKKLTATSIGYDNFYGFNYPAVVLFSTDKGVNWQPVSVPISQIFRAAALSLDGSTMMLMNSQFGQYSFRYIMAQPGVPALNIANAGGNASLTWPYLTPGYVLQQNTNLAGTNWVTVTNTPAAVNQIILAPTNANNFYRLQKP